jgi:hypothetical protein
MATVQFVNNIQQEINLSDIGYVIPAEGATETDPDLLRKLVDSNMLRTALDNNDVTINDGVANLAAAEAKVYLSILWQKAGRDDVCGIRVIASGQTLINANTSVDLITLTKFPTERLAIFLFPTNDVNGLAFCSSLSLLGDSVRGFFERTNVPNQCKARASNGNLLSSRTVDWAVVGIKI